MYGTFIKIKGVSLFYCHFVSPTQILIMNCMPSVFCVIFDYLMLLTRSFYLVCSILPVCLSVV